MLPALTMTWLPQAIVGAINRPLALVRVRVGPLAADTRGEQKPYLYSLPRSLTIGA